MRHFYEDIIGLPLVATWTEKAPSTGRETATRSSPAATVALAFFQYAGRDEQPVNLSSPGHIAFECDPETLHSIRGRLEASGYAVRVTDYGYCVLLYVTDPNNLRLEFTVDHPEVGRINADQLGHAHESLQRWLAGDHTPNND